MKKAENNNLPAFHGAGYLLGFAITMVTAITVFVLSENVTVSISAGVPIGTTMGILFEQKFRNGNEAVGERERKVIMGLLIIGIVVFITLFFFARFI